MGMAHLFALLQSVDAFLNLAWLLAAGAALCWWGMPRHAPRQTRAVLALAFVLILLFPIISSADDIAEQALACDVTPSSLTVKNSKEIRFVTPDVLPAILGTLPGPSLPAFAGYRVNATPVEPCAFLLSSATGIHSPPLF